MRIHCDRAVLRGVMAAVAMAVCGAASAQVAAPIAPWAAGPQQAAADWAPEAFADYLLSGQKPHPAVVRIVAAEQGAASLGSGVLVDVNRDQGLVLTNWHVVRDSRSAVLVQFPDGFQTAGTVIRTDEAWDLAALVIWRPPVPPIPLAKSPPVPGDLLTIAGYGRGPYRAQSGRCTEYLSPATGYPKEFVELAAAARQGDSGGPILNDRGELAGVLFGQNGGRTIGSCSTRLRTFLASVGSSGVDPTMAAIAAGQPVTGDEVRASEPRMRMAAAAIGGVGQADAQIAVGDLTAAPLALPPPPPPLDGLYAGLPDNPVALGGQAPPWSGRSLPSTVRMPSLEEITATLDPRTNGPVLLSAAGGTALVVVGFRTLFGGRRRNAAARPMSDDID
jgi:hypothetical protein